MKVDNAQTMYEKWLLSCTNTVTEALTDRQYEQSANQWDLLHKMSDPQSLNGRVNNTI